VSRNTPDTLKFVKEDRTVFHFLVRNTVSMSYFSTTELKRLYMVLMTLDSYFYNLFCSLWVNNSDLVIEILARSGNFLIYKIIAVGLLYFKIFQNR
jgi:cellulose synthase/poly-beta-1,6-N-acetylglucosamine synthase-like glycosyltransferase